MRKLWPCPAAACLEVVKLSYKDNTWKSASGRGAVTALLDSSLPQD